MLSQYSIAHEDIKPAANATRGGGSVTPDPSSSGSGSTGGSTSTLVVPKKDLQTGSISEDVRNLQKYLNAKGYTVSTSGAGAPGHETTTFGAATRAALIKFQKANKISPASGYFGPLTRAFMNKNL